MQHLLVTLSALQLVRWPEALRGTNYDATRIARGVRGAVGDLRMLLGRDALLLPEGATRRERAGIAAGPSDLVFLRTFSASVPFSDSE